MLIDFLTQAFDAKETYRLDGPNGAVMYAEVKIGNSMVIVGEATDQWKPMPTTVALYGEDTDGWYQRALRAGATSVREPSNQFYGDRSVGVKDWACNNAAECHQLLKGDESRSSCATDSGIFFLPKGWHSLWQRCSMLVCRYRVMNSARQH
jgi:hypothetical protein